MSSSPDPVVTLRDAWFWWAHQSPSFAYVRGREETSTHRLHIGGYSTVSTVYGHGEGVESKPFGAGGHRWKLTYYPNGYPGSTTGSPGVVLRLLDSRFFSRAANATAGLTVTVPNRDGNVLCPPCVELQVFRSSWGSSGIWIDVRKRGTTVEETKAALHPCRPVRAQRASEVGEGVQAG